MRLFPRTARRRLAATAAVCSLALGAFAIPQALAAPPDLKNEQKQAQRDIKSAEQDLDESSSQLRNAQAAVDSARAELVIARADYRVASTRLSAAKVRDREMRLALAVAEDKLEVAQQDLVNGRAALDAQRETVTNTITDIYEQGDPELLAFSSLLDAETPADLTRRMEARNVIVGNETRAYDDLHAAEVLLEVRETRVEDARDEVEVQRQAAADHLVTTEQLFRETRTARDTVRDLVTKTRAARVDARQARQSDQRALRRAKQHEERIKRQILAAARRAKGGYSGATDGLLAPPVSGAVTSPYGYRIHPIYGYWGLHDGTDFGVSCGQGMHAVAGGTVMAKYYSAVYGNRLYLNLGQINGKNVTAVYNHATGYRVNVGDRVTRGEVVGYVGSTGWSTGCHLHFTILVNGSSVDPMSWLS